MENYVITQELLEAFREHLHLEERSTLTVEKYFRDIGAFLAFLGEREVSKQAVLEYKAVLVERGYAVRSVNSMLASIHSLFTFLGWQSCKVKCLKAQRQIYRPEEKELTKGEYLRLLRAAAHRPKLHLVLETICATGIRVSELKYFTLSAVRRGEICVACKNKIRTILLPAKLRQLLLRYAREQKIHSGAIFVTRNGKPLDRSNIWAQMKSLCAQAGVPRTKVFPHNLRKLFARTFYAMERDIAKLADILGHTNVNTTRIYIISTGTEHRRKIERLGLLV